MRSVQVCATEQARVSGLQSAEIWTRREGQPAIECVLALCIVKGAPEDGGERGKRWGHGALRMAEGEKLLDGGR